MEKRRKNGFPIAGGDDKTDSKVKYKSRSLGRDLHAGGGPTLFSSGERRKYQKFFPKVSGRQSGLTLRLKSQKETTRKERGEFSYRCLLKIIRAEGVRISRGPRGKSRIRGGQILGPHRRSRGKGGHVWKKPTAEEGLGKPFPSVSRRKPTTPSSRKGDLPPQAGGKGAETTLLQARRHEPRKEPKPFSIRGRGGGKYPLGRVIGVFWL